MVAYANLTERKHSRQERSTDTSEQHIHVEKVVVEMQTHPVRKSKYVGGTENHQILKRSEMEGGKRQRVGQGKKNRILQ